MNNTSAPFSYPNARFGVVLTGLPAAMEQRQTLAVLLAQLNPAQAAAQLKAALTASTRLEASLPMEIVTGVLRVEAIALANKFESAGATVEIQNERPG